MNWEREIELEWDNRVSGWIKLSDLLDLMTASLTRDEAEQFGGELIKFAKISLAPLLLGD